MSITDQDEEQNNGLWENLFQEASLWTDFRRVHTPVLPLVPPPSSILLVVAEAKAAGEKKQLHPDFKKRQNEWVWGTEFPLLG